MKEVRDHGRLLKFGSIDQNKEEFVRVNVSNMRIYREKSYRYT